MSFDLRFRAREGARPFMYDDFADYFGRRVDFTVDGAAARYFDEATGVHFGFKFTAEHMEREKIAFVGAALPGAHADGDIIPVTFSLPFCRPHIFALEAEPEVAAFVHAFDLQVADSQEGGMGEADFTMAAFLAAYDRGNRVAVRVLLDHVADRPPQILPQARIEWYWYWNRHRRLSELAREKGRPYADRREGVFVPKVMFLEMAGEARSAVVWPDAIPISLPAVDVLILAREKLAPRRLGRRHGDVCLIPYASARDLLEEFPLAERPLPHRLLAYGEPPEPVAAFIRAQDRWEGELEGLAVDLILDAEVVAAASRF